MIASDLFIVSGRDLTSRVNLPVREIYISTHVASL